MRSTICKPIGLALVAAAFAWPAPAHAAAMCQGKEATIVDEDGGMVAGTDGNDVIVARGAAATVDALGGDDLVCVVSGEVFAGLGHDSVQARGTDGSEGVTVWHGEDLDIDLAGGRDGVGMYFTQGGSGTVDAGPGGGHLWILTNSSVVVDLEDGVLAFDPEASRYVVDGLDDVFVTAQRVALEGDAHDNLLSVAKVACEMTVKGGRGHDELEIKGNLLEHPGFDCDRKPEPRLIGQRGNDKLLGRGYDDVLIGGLGRDLAKGSFGSDKCRAEREKGCEK